MKPSYVDFSIKSYPWNPTIDYRKNPELYKIGKGQQGVLICQPYKSEIGPHWRFKTPEIAKKSSKIIYDMFLSYLSNKDFVGADMAKKYLHMGFTRARRYANHSSGKKWKKNDSEWEILPQEKDWKTNEKSKSADIFYVYWKKARENKIYLKMKENFLAK
tara:strand:- start:58 stop:537 length:480 start_codon:yes stop_codon:yes gene_type:complete